MAKNDFQNSQRLYREISDNILKGIFAPVYVLMGEEPYYCEKLARLIQEHALEDWERDFNETVCFGADVDADFVVTASRRFPMMAERQLVMVKEAQAMRSIEELSVYCQKPLDSTVLVLLLRGSSLDKRKALYKAASKAGVVFESVPVRDTAMPVWISEYYASRGLDIDPDAARLLAEYSGTDLSKLESETDKLMRNLPQGSRKVTVDDIEKNVDISRQFSIFELTKALSYRSTAKALKTAAYIGRSARFAMAPAVSALFIHFNRVLKYEALLASNPHPGADQKARVLGVQPYFFGEYDEAVRNYPLPRAMKVIALLEEYDFKGKGGDSGAAAPSELLTELVMKILTV